MTRNMRVVLAIEGQGNLSETLEEFVRMVGKAGGFETGAGHITDMEIVDLEDTTPTRIQEWIDKSG